MGMICGSTVNKLLEGKEGEGKKKIRLRWMDYVELVSGMWV